MVDLNDTKPVVEASANAEPLEITKRTLEQRIHQQELLSQLGVIALQGATLDQLLAETVRVTAAGLWTEFCKVLEYIPAENRLLVKAGVGWDAGIVGVASVGADLASPAGFALRTGKPVISNHLENEERFRTPEILAQHGIRRAMNVILQGDGKPFGVLEVDSRSEDEFVEHDLAFLQGAANILGMAIERERRERHLKRALERQQFLMKEMNHRIKNSLAIVASILRLQARELDSPELTEKLEETSLRVSAVARAHERLYRDDVESIDLGTYVEELCKDMDTSVANCTIHVKAEHGIHIRNDNAVSVAIIILELITNCAKHAYPNHKKGEIWVRIERNPARDITISVRDEGGGLPADFKPTKMRGLGMRILTAFVSQLNAKLVYNNQSPGSEFEIIIPRASFGDSFVREAGATG